MRTIELNGTWQLLDTALSPDGLTAPQPATADWATARDAIVPGEVHLDLLRHGRIAEPLYAANANDCAWVENRAWWFRRTFTAPATPVATRAELVCEGLDTNAILWLNHTEIGRTDNAFIPHRFDVTTALQNGENTLLIRLDCGSLAAKHKPVQQYGIGDGAPESKWVRKAQFTFGWDWAPRLLNCGIWRPIRLEFLDAAVLRDVWVRSRLEPDGSAAVTVTTEIENLTRQPLDATLQLTAPHVGTQTLDLHATPPGIRQVETTFHVAHPQLWWPRPLGNAVMHTVQAALKQGATTLDTRTTHFGIREIKLLQEPLPDVPAGRTFTLVVNGEKVFANGANWAPPDCIIPRVSPEKYDYLLTQIRDANLNMLRVWGGGIFEDERFYRFCDENGILLWHDFMMACFIFPGDDPGFRANFSHEITAAVRLLRNHPSIAIWCGSNETDWAFDSNWYPGCQANTSLVLEHELIPALLQKLDPDRPYRPTSPFGGKDVNDEDQGDQHWWAISIATGGNDTLDYRNYRRAHCTFNSEYGYFAMPDLASMREYLPEQDLRVDTENFRFHVNRHGFMEKGQRSKIKVLEAIDLLYGDSAALTLEQQIYASQLLQAEALRTATEHARRRKFACGGSMFWMFPDAWGEVGWSVIDYYLRKKTAYYYVKRASAPLLVSIKEEECGVSTWLINDTRSPVRGTLERQLVSFEGKILTRHAEPVEIPPNSAIRCAMERMTLMRSGDFYLARLSDGNTLLTQNTFLFMNIKSVKMPPATVSLRVEHRTANSATLCLTTDRFAHCVRLDLPPGLEPDDNCFDLLPGTTRQIILRGNTAQLDKIRLQWRNRPTC